VLQLNYTEYVLRMV